MASDSEREAVAAELDRHADEEMEIVRQYCDLSEHLEDGPMSFLIEHILTEENIHHYLLRSLASWLRDPLAGGESAGPQGEIRDELLRHTRALQEHERESIDACKSLKSQLPREEGQLLGTVLDAMAMDCAKHHMLLSVVAKMMQA
jgi:hypothetical protein